MIDQRNDLYAQIVLAGHAHGIRITGHFQLRFGRPIDGIALTGQGWLVGPDGQRATARVNYLT